jgi:hypothetical protein
VGQLCDRSEVAVGCGSQCCLRCLSEGLWTPGWQTSGLRHVRRLSLCQLGRAYRWEWRIHPVSGLPDLEESDRVRGIAEERVKVIVGTKKRPAGPMVVNCVGA